MTVLGIDPGPRVFDEKKGAYKPNTGLAWWDGKRADSRSVTYDELVDQIVRRKFHLKVDVVAIEVLESYGSVVGADTFDTAEVIGAITALMKLDGVVPIRIRRKEVKRHFTGSIQGKAKELTLAMEDALGGAGTKAKPGSIFGVSGHCMSALGVAAAVWEDIRGELRMKQEHFKSTEELRRILEATR